MDISRTALALFLPLALLGACSDDPTVPVAEPTSTPSPSPTVGSSPSPSPSRSAQTGCINESGALAEERLGEDALEGDATGDGSPERVSVVRDEDALVGCQGFVVVELGDEYEVLAIDEPMMEVQFGLPDLVGLEEIDGLPGADAIVRVTQGASTSFLAVYSVGSGGWSKVPTEGARAYANGLFPYGGSVGHVDAVDCTESHVVVSSAVPTPSGARYRLIARYFRPVEGILVLDKAMTERQVVDPGSREFDEAFGGAPFANC